MKYKFKCPKCGGTVLVLVEDVLTTTVIESASKSVFGMDVDEFGETEQLETTESHGYECFHCLHRWPGLDEIDEDGGFVPMEDIKNE